jgi:hypothetical protein
MAYEDWMDERMPRKGESERCVDDRCILWGAVAKARSHISVSKLTFSIGGSSDVHKY